MLYRQMPSNIQLHLINLKDSIKQNRSSSIKIKCRIARMEVDYSSSNLFLWQQQQQQQLYCALGTKRLNTLKTNNCEKKRTQPLKKLIALSGCDRRSRNLNCHSCGIWTLLAGFFFSLHLFFITIGDFYLPTSI